jgi:type II secretory pathway pseudopilin PulG
MVELLTVVAITGILLTIIVIPIFQSFNLTRTAQAFTEAQSKARLVASRIAREVGDSVSVRDNSGYRGALTLAVPGNTANSLVVTTVPGLKIDLVQASQGDPAGFDANGRPIFIDPNTGKVDPTLRTPKGQVGLPVTPGQTIVRYFVGINRPFESMSGTTYRVLSYSNPYDGLLMQRASGRDNLFVLYRAEIQPFVRLTNGNYVPDPRYFETNSSGQIVLDDTAFFTMLPDVDYATGTPEVTIRQLLDTDFTTVRTKQERIQNWRRVATIVTELSRYDMILPVFDKRTRAVAYDNRTDFADATQRNRPRLIPLIQFKPSRVNSDPAESEMANRLGEETDNGLQVASDVYSTSFAGWSNAVVRLWPEGFNAASAAANEYTVGRQVAVAAGREEFRIFQFDPDIDGPTDTLGGIDVFNATAYEEALDNGLRFPFSQALINANLNDTTRSRFAAYFPDPRRGRILASFSVSELGNFSLPPLPGDGLNLPIVSTGPALSVVQETATDWQNATTINQRFNRVWHAFPWMQLADGTGAHRFIDLRHTNQADGTQGPLNLFSRARIVPGSEEVWGPDQNAGPNYGAPIRYTRTTRAPGPNQYRINYVDLPEPDYALLGLPTPPTTYDPASFVSAIYQPRFKTGYIQLNSDPNVPLPAGDVRVGYRFQFTRAQDVFAVDYDSRQLLEVQLTIRNYPQSTVPTNETVTLRATATVRNFIR